MTIASKASIVVSRAKAKPPTMATNGRAGPHRNRPSPVAMRHPGPANARRTFTGFSAGGGWVLPAEREVAGAASAAEKSESEFFTIATFGKKSDDSDQP